MNIVQAVDQLPVSPANTQPEQTTPPSLISRIKRAVRTFLQMIAQCFLDTQNRVIDFACTISSCLYYILLEVIATCLAIHYFFHDLAAQDHAPDPLSDQTPILFIHGHLHNSSGGIYHKEQLKNAGFDSVYTINLGSCFQSLEECSEKVKEKARQIQQWTNCNQIIIIGHSMGGTVGLHFAANRAHELGITASKVVTFASPLSGTYLAYLSPVQQAKQLRPHSNFLEALHQKIEEELTDTEILNIGSDYDTIIFPARSAFLPGRRHELVPEQHLSQLYSKRVSDIIIRFLR